MESGVREREFAYMLKKMSIDLPLYDFLEGTVRSYRFLRHSARGSLVVHKRLHRLGATIQQTDVAGMTRIISAGNRVQKPNTAVRSIVIGETHIKVV